MVSVKYFFVHRKNFRVNIINTLAMKFPMLYQERRRILNREKIY
jgi:hypothetical protein